MDPADYDPAEDADAPPEAYMKPTVVDAVLAELHTVNGNGQKRRVIKHRRHVNHRKGWIDPRKRKKMNAGSSE